MLELSPETEALVQARAAHAGQTPDQLIRDAVLRHAAPRAVPMTPRPALDLAKAEAIIARAAARPVLDPRSADEIIGYDAFGVPR